MSEPSEPDYSRAFETLINDPDSDIVGLLAYSLYKTSIRERVRAGQDVPRHLRNPTQAEKNAYRGQAERVLESYAARVIEDAEPQIADSAREEARSDIIDLVDEPAHEQSSGRSVSTTTTAASSAFSAPTAGSIWPTGREAPDEPSSFVWPGVFG